MMINIISSAVGHWDAIFQSLNIDVFPKNQHKPCPVCGGRDRFRYDDKNGKGDFICNQCGAGDGINLIERIYHCNTKEAIKMVAECLNLRDNKSQLQDNLVFKKDTNIPENPVCKKVEYLLSQSKLGQSEYLTKKGLRFDLPLLNDGRIIVPMLNLRNEYTGAQFIEVGGSKHLMKGSNKNGSFIPILQKNEMSYLQSFEDFLDITTRAREVIICEGVATGITLSLIKSDTAILAAIDAGNLIHVARSIREVNPTAKIIIAGDNDIGADKNVGKDKAIEAANAVNGYYSIPDTDYKCDWDDYRQRHGLDRTLNSFDENLLKPETENMSKLDIQNDLSRMNLSQMASSQRAQLLNEHYGNNLALNITTKEIYHYQGNHWTMIDDEILKRSLTEMFIHAGEPFNPMRITSAVESLRLTLPLMDKPNRDLICFKNGIYDLSLNQFREHNKNDWLMTSNNINYYPAKGKESFKTHAPNFYRWLTRATAKNQTKIKNVLAALYIVLANRYDWQLFLEVTGAGGSGKSVFAEICTMLAGKQNTVNGTMESLDKARERAILVGHSLIILPDQPRYMGAGAGLKAITGGDDVAIDPKHKQPYSTKIKAVVLIINNEAMKFNERNGGISRRRVIFHFGEVIPEKERDLNLVSKIEQELPSIVRLLLNEFTNPLDAKERLHMQQKSDEAIEIKRESDHLIAFCSYLDALDYPNGMFIGSLGTIPFSPRKYLYHAYIEFMRNNGLNNPLSLPQFGVSISYAMNENGKRYHKKRTNQGIRTNLDINIQLSGDWLPKSEMSN